MCDLFCRGLVLGMALVAAGREGHDDYHDLVTAIFVQGCARMVGHTDCLQFVAFF